MSYRFLSVAKEKEEIKVVSYRATSLIIINKTRFKVLHSYDK